MGVLDEMLAVPAREVDPEWLMIDSTIPSYGHIVMPPAPTG